MTEVENAIFVGGPWDGERHALIGMASPVIYFHESPPGMMLYIFPSRHRDLTLKPYIREYRRIGRTPGGVAIYEIVPQPERCTHVFTVEVEGANGSDLAVARECLQEVLDRIVAARGAFTGGIYSAKIVAD